MNTTEKKLILACSRTDLTQVNIKKIRQYAGVISDWKAVLRAATFHGVFPIVYRALQKACSDIVPAHILERFKALYRDNATKNLSASATLLKILGLFKANGILAVPFKGPLIAVKAYGDVGLRMFGDLDIFIKKTDAIRAKSLLVENGYHADINLSPEKEQQYLEFENSFSFYHPKGGIPIDLHWEMSGRYLLKPICLDTFENNLQSLDFMGQNVLTIPDDVMLLYLCIHGASHCWERLEWLCGFSRYARLQYIDLPTVITLAETMGCKRMLYLGMHLSHDLLKTEIPEELIDNIADDQGVTKAGEKIKQILLNPIFNTTGDAEWRFSPIHIHIRDTYVDRLKYAVCLYTAPTVKEWSRLPLPSCLTPLYRIMRPLRLGKTLISRGK